MIKLEIDMYATANIHLDFITKETYKGFYNIEDMNEGGNSIFARLKKIMR